MAPRIKAKIKTIMQTIIVVPTSSSFVGQETFFISALTSLTKVIILFIQTPKADVLAGQEGFEPPTRGFGVRRSTN